MTITCCLEAFPGSSASATSYPIRAILITPQSQDAPDLPGASSYTLEPGPPAPGLPSPLRPPFAVILSTGILTCCPSTTLFSLALGVDLPCPDERWTGNLSLSASGLFTRFIVTHVSIRTSDTSKTLLRASSSAYRTLPYHAFARIRSFGAWFSPVTSSAQADSTSELLRFLSMMAASKPTSWLSKPSHIVSHLTMTSGP